MFPNVPGYQNVVPNLNWGLIISTLQPLNPKKLFLLFLSTKKRLPKDIFSILFVPWKQEKCTRNILDYPIMYLIVPVNWKCSSKINIVPFSNKRHLSESKFSLSDILSCRYFCHSLLFTLRQYGTFFFSDLFRGGQCPPLKPSAGGKRTVAPPPVAAFVYIYIF